MIRTLFIACGALVLATTSWSFPCYLTVVKDNCWTDYDVSINVIDSENGAKVRTVTIPKKKQWIRVLMDCHTSEKFMYIAQFSPVFWQSDKGKTYMAKHYWSLPDKIHPQDTAWTLSVCFANDFSLVPSPPQAVSSCVCDFSKLPPIEVE